MPLFRRRTAVSFLSGLAGARGRLSGFSLMSAGNVLTAVLTYLRQAEIARVFGTSGMTDAYAVALVFPILAQQVIAHAFGSSFVPVYTEVLHRKGRAAAAGLVNRILCWIGISGGLLILALLGGSRGLVTIAGPGLGAGNLDLSAGMLRIMLPMLVLVASTGILTGLLSAQRRFGAVSAVSVANIAVSFATVAIFHARLGIMVLPVSGLAGSVAGFAISAAFAVGSGHVPRFEPDPRDADFSRLLGLSAPVMTGAVLGFLGPMADRALASVLAESSVTAMDYAARIRDMALAVLFLPMSALADVGLSEKSARNDMPAFGEELRSLLNWTSFLMLPAAVLLSMFATPAVSVLFMRGSFDRESAELVGRALAFYAPWLAQFGFGAVISRGFYAMKDTGTPVLIGIWGMAANVLLNVILMDSMGIAGLALSSTLTSTAKTILLVHLFRRKSPDISFRPVLIEHARLLAAVAAMIPAGLLLSRVLPVGLDAGFAGRAANLALVTTLSAGVYGLVCLLLGASPARIAAGRLRRARSSG